MWQIETIPEWKRIEDASIADTKWRKLSAPVQQTLQQEMPVTE